jgi:hypothetical protein
MGEDLGARGGRGEVRGCGIEDFLAASRNGYGESRTDELGGDRLADPGPAACDEGALCHGCHSFDLLVLFAGYWFF